MRKVIEIQNILGVVQDGIWGPKSQTALIAATGPQKRMVQRLLGVTQDGVWGPKSQAAMDLVIHQNWVKCDGSSFADPADVAAFVRCKATGKTDVQCFAVGDNGVGQFGKVTAQEHTPMIAVHKDAMKARWGSVLGAAHRKVQVKHKNKIIDATVEDRISAPGRIDLNPACAKKFGLKPPFVIPVAWRWV